MIKTDALIIGAGPTGLFTAHQLKLIGLDCEIVDNLDKIGGQCIELYPDKPIYDIPAIPECTGEELTNNLLKQLKPFNIKFHLGERVDELKKDNESFRVFPLSNWTEVDVWQYIYQENIPIVPLYFAKVRPVVVRDGMIIMVDDDRFNIQSNEKIELKRIRFRTLGCYPLTGAIESNANSLEDIVLELLQSKTSERQGRAIDTDSSSSMEIKKIDGYF